jgi:hypothetical protein
MNVFGHRITKDQRTNIGYIGYHLKQRCLRPTRILLTATLEGDALGVEILENPPEGKPRAY